jgi:phosphatidylserine decarboxylase
MKKLSIVIVFGIALMLAVGLPLGAPTTLLAGLGIAYTVGWIIFFRYWKTIHFYRDPKRSPAEAGDDVIVSPADGRVQAIYRHQAKVNLPMVDMWEYVNFMLFRRAVNLFSRRFHFENERASLLMERADGLKYVVVLIADKFVNKIRLSVEEGVHLPKSGKLGFIDRGSQADLFIADPDIEIVTKVGRQVYGGKTTLARAAVRE